MVVQIRERHADIATPPAPAAVLIDAVGLGRRFGPTVAVADVSLQVAGGTVLALLGPNGAGKTTTMQMLAGLLPPTTGHAAIHGYDVVRASEAVRARVGLMVDEPGFYPEMTIEEYLLFVARLYRVPTPEARTRIADLLERFGLGTKRRARLSALSKGMRQKVALARAVVHAPPVLLLDEPTSALDPLSAQAVHQFIMERRRAGDAIIISTHNLPEAEALADRVAIIAAGRLRRQGTPAELCRAPDGLETFALALGGECAYRADKILPIVRDVPGVRDLAPAEAARTAYERHGRCELTYRTATPERTNAALTATLAAHGLPMVTLTHRPRRLHEVYLDTIADTVARAAGTTEATENRVTEAACPPRS